MNLAPRSCTFDICVGRLSSLRLHARHAAMRGRPGCSSLDAATLGTGSILLAATALIHSPIHSLDGSPIRSRVSLFLNV